MMCTNFVMKYRNPNFLWKSGKPVFQSITKNLFVKRFFQDLVKSYCCACDTHNLHSTLSLQSKVQSYLEKEKEYAHNIIENKPPCSGTVVKNFTRMSSQSSSKISQKFIQGGADRHLLFVYGTLKRQEPNHDVMQDVTKGIAIFRGVGRTVQKWPMVIASKYNIPFLLYSAGKGEHVFGEIYEVDDQMLKFMDEFECHPNYYTRLREEVQPEDPEAPPLKPWTYFLCNYKEELLQLPCLADYHTDGPHGLPYVVSEDTCDPEDIYR